MIVLKRKPTLVKRCVYMYVCILLNDICEYKLEREIFQNFKLSVEFCTSLF